MDRAEAVKKIKEIQKLYVFTPTINEALDLAIEALSVADDEVVDFNNMISAGNRIRNLPPIKSERPKEEWIPVSERLPKDLEEVVVTWVNRNPPVYYRHEKDKPQTGFAVLYRDTWHWWDSTIVDVLAEYGLRCDIEHISEDIEILAWQPLPEPYKGGDTE